MSYFGFGSLLEKRRWICKSEITSDNLKKMGFPDFINVKEVVSVFNLIDDPIYVRWVVVGSSKFKKQRKHVKYVLKSALYRYFVKNSPF